MTAGPAERLGAVMPKRTRLVVALICLAGLVAVATAAPDRSLTAAGTIARLQSSARTLTVTLADGSEAMFPLERRHQDQRRARPGREGDDPLRRGRGRQEPRPADQRLARLEPGPRFARIPLAARESRGEEDEAHGDVHHRGTVHRHQGHRLRRRVSGRLHPPPQGRGRLRDGRDALHRPRRLHPVRQLRAGLPGDGDLHGRDHPRQVEALPAGERGLVQENPK